MRNQPRDVTGGDQMLANIVPGFGLMNYVLGWFTVPIEVFLRRDFGERYFTKANFFAGLIVLIIFRFASSLLSMLNPVAWLTGGSGESPGSWMGSVMTWYIVLSFVHFARIWWNDITSRPVHSFSSGRSWLRIFAIPIMGLLNIFLNLAVRLLFKIIPGTDQKGLDTALPVLRDVDVFTERFIEPVAVFWLAIYCSGAGQMSMFFWLFFSLLALNLSTGERHRAQRNYVLDMLDSIIDSQIINDALNGKDSRGSERMERVIKETAREVEKNPEIIEVIKRQQPTLADAIAAMNAKRKQAQENDALQYASNGMAD